jgi:hypothetical protein
MPSDDDPLNTPEARAALVGMGTRELKKYRRLSEKRDAVWSQMLELERQWTEFTRWWGLKNQKDRLDAALDGMARGAAMWLSGGLADKLQPGEDDCQECGGSGCSDWGERCHKCFGDGVMRPEAATEKPKRKSTKKKASKRNA